MLSIARQPTLIASRSLISRSFTATAVSLKKRDPSLPVAPKAAPGSYVLYVQEQFAKRRDEFTKDGKIDIRSASEAISAEWASLAADVKDKFTSQAASLKKASDAEYRKWFDSLDAATIKAIEADTGRKVRVPGGKRVRRQEQDARDGNPGRPVTAFFEYLASFREGEGKGLGVVEAAKQAAEKWKIMVEEEKESFKRTAADKKTKYLEWQKTQEGKQK